MAARVFISCGQAKDTNEVETARSIAQRLRDLGFDPYIAVEEQTLRGLKENIFERLRESEYLIFIDFRRETLGPGSDAICRGSLFSHQELAIAAFLGIDVIAMQEKGVRPSDGMLGILQANAEPFSDRSTLHRLIAEKIDRRGWSPRWRNELVLERRSEQFSDARQINGRTGRYFHVDVRNQHRDKLATNCYVYLEKMTDLRREREVPLRTAEFYWAGTTLPSVAIAANTVRPFDAFFIEHAEPTCVRFSTHSTSTEFIPSIPAGEGQYKLGFVVVSDTFPPARGTFHLELNSTLGLTAFS